MNFKSTLTLLVLLIVVFAALMYVRHNPPADRQTSPEASSGGSALFAPGQLPAEKVERIALTYADGRRLVLAGQQDDWWQQEPVRFPIETRAALNLAEAAARLHWLEKVRPGGGNSPGRQAMGLDPALVKMELAGTTGGEEPRPFAVTILIGKHLAGRMYVALEDEEAAYVVDDELASRLFDEDILEWRRRDLPAPTVQQAQKLVLRQGEQTVEVIKDQGHWMFAAPLAGRVDEEAVSRILGALGNVYITQFVADEPKDAATFGLDKPTMELQVTSLGAPASDVTPVTTAQAASPGGDTGNLTPHTMTLRIGGHADLSGAESFATWDQDHEPGQVVFAIGKQDAQALTPELESLRDRRFSSLKPAEVMEILIRRTGLADLELERKGTNWAFVQPAGKDEPDNEEAEKWLGQILAAKAQHFVKDYAPQQEPLAQVKLTATAGKQPQSMRLYPFNGEIPPPQPAATAEVEAKAEAAQDRESAPAGGRAAGEATSGVQPSKAMNLVLYEGEDIGYVIAAADLDALFAPALSLRQRTVVDLPPQRLRSLTVTEPDGTRYELVRAMASTQPASQPATAEPMEWSLANEERIEQAALDQLLAQLAPLKAQQWAEKAEIPGQALTLAFAATDGLTGEIRINPETRLASLRTSAEQRESYFEVSPQLVEAASAELRYRTALPVGFSQIAQVTVEDGGTTLVILRDAARRYITPDNRKLDQAAVSSLFDSLAGLRVERYLPLSSASQPAKQGRLFTITTTDGRTMTVRLLEQDPPRVLIDGKTLGQIGLEVAQKMAAELLLKTGGAQDYSK
ncbi:MAG: DUF4340 domain-containing protein [Phycisphaeraceae bacterium]|nr:DUF4340 domain-containing protein [Phycisphaeraceae bacterium]